MVPSTCPSRFRCDGSAFDYIAYSSQSQGEKTQADARRSKRNDVLDIRLAFLSAVKDSVYEWIPLADDPMIAVLPKGHPLAAGDAYPLSACNQEEFIMPALGKDSDVIELFDRAGIHPDITYSTFEAFAAFALIENGLGMTITNQLITDGFQMDVVKLPLDPPQHISFGIMFPDQNSLSPASRMFIKYAKRII